MLMSRKVLCGVYAAIALVALVATWSQNIVHVRDGGSFLGFFEALKVNPASRAYHRRTSSCLVLRWRS